MVGRCEWFLVDFSTKAGRGRSEIQVQLGYGYKAHRAIQSHLRMRLLEEE